MRSWPTDMTTPRELKTLYEQGTNISAYLRHEKKVQRNAADIIEIAYDLQTGTYIAAMEDAAVAKHQEEYTAEIAKTILALYEPKSILEAGIGEATTLSGVVSRLGVDVDIYGFDLSWSRVAFANHWLQQHDITNASLCTGDLLHIPFADNSIDIVYTSHSIEPNRDREEAILRELFRVTREFLILLEPGYDLADSEARARMDFHGYCRNLKGAVDALGYDVLKHERFPLVANPLNPTAITVIRKHDSETMPSHVLACPKYKTPLQEIGGLLFSPEALVVYPIIAGVPCLRIENGIFASKYHEVTERAHPPQSFRS